MNADKNSMKMKIRDVENVFRYRRIPYPKRSVELIALIAISCTFFLFMHTKNLNTRLREMEVKLQPSEFSALGLTGGGEHHASGGDSRHPNDINTLHGTYQYLKSTGQLDALSASQLNNTKNAERDLLFFNRVPKVGSEQLIELLRRLSKINNFNAARASFYTPVRSRLDELEQLNMATEIDEMTEATSYTRHVNYINFTKYNLPKPIYINLIRDPVERVISWFYYRRTPWTAVSMYKVNNGFRKPAWYKKSFDQCVASGDMECLYPQESEFKTEVLDHRRQTLFFCGHEPICEPFNSEGAMQLAKRNVEKEYAVVGSWEDVNVTLTVLEHYVPQFLKGAFSQYYSEGGLGQTIQNKNTWKGHVEEQTKALLRKNFTKEYEFYSFCKQRLYKQYFAIQNDIHKI